MFFSRDNMPKNLFNAKINLSGKQKAGIAITLLYALITFLLCSRHEMWGDELNVWMALKYLSFPELLKFSSRAGNPIFFFLPLLPFVKLGCSAAIIQIFCWACSVLAVFMLNMFAPFSVFTNILITFSAPFLYHYSVMARCYSVLPPLMFIMAIIYPYINGQEIHFTEKNIFSSLSDKTLEIIYALCLAAIAMTHIIAFVFAGGMAALFIYERFFKSKKYGSTEIISVSLMLFGMAAVTAQTLYAMRTNDVFESNPLLLKDILSASFIYFSSMTDAFASDLFIIRRSSGFLANILGPVCLFIFFFGLYILFRKKKAFALITLGTFLLHDYISVTSYSKVLPYRTYLAVIILTALFWAAEKSSAKNNIPEQEKGQKAGNNKNKGTEIILAGMMLLFIPTGIEIIAADWKQNFSSAYETALFIKKNIPNNDKTAIISAAMPVAYYLPERDIYYSYGKPLKTMLMEKDTTIDLLPFRKSEKDVYCIATAMQKEAFSDYELIYESPEAMIPYESFCIFKIF
ncbi:MAG: hypothetical protein K5838_03390 [Elusimicrobiales bacterium]|nr:hypothetical protein [Elusimicrobiales bacterium]